MGAPGFGMAMRKNEHAASATRARTAELGHRIRKARRARSGDEALAPVENVTCMSCGTGGTTLTMGREEGGFLCFSCEVDRDVAAVREHRRYNAVAIAAILAWTALVVALVAVA